MKQNQISDLPKLDTENIENMFNVYQTETGNYYYNLLETISFPQNLPLSLFEVYSIVPGDTWPLISYKAFKTPNLWWLILVVNNIQNPLLPLEISKSILIPRERIIQEVLSKITKPGN